jgi:hypothetical protein
MKIISFLIITILAVACKSSYQTIGQDKSHKNTSINEDIEWSHTWVVSTNKYDLPKVLIIGDSHVERYYQNVTDKLINKAYCNKFTTSRSLGDPVLIDQLRAIFNAYKFDIICFNNGLHGAIYSVNQYSNYIPYVYRLFKNNNLNIKLIWVNTTARRIPGNLTDFDKYNAGIINRNKAITAFTKAKQISLIDFYSLSVNHMDYYEPDEIHFNQKGVEEEANAVTLEILKAINNLKGNN